MKVRFETICLITIVIILLFFSYQKTNRQVIAFNYLSDQACGKLNRYVGTNPTGPYSNEISIPQGYPRYYIKTTYAGK